MKKSVFCVLLALLVSLFSGAYAENAGCCACCSAAGCTATSDTPADSARTVRPSKYDLEGFTTEVDQCDFKFFLPASFESNLDFPGSYRSKYSSFYPYVRIESEPRLALLPVDAFYADREQLRHSLDVYTVYHSDYEVIQMDECLGLMQFWQSKDSDACFAMISVTNRKDICDVTVISDSRDETLELAYAIIDHAIAKEFPLEEVESSRYQYDYTVEVVLEDYHIFLPGDPEDLSYHTDPERYGITSELKYPRISPYILVSILDENDLPFPAYYANSDELLDHLNEYADSGDWTQCEIVQADECLGVARYSESKYEIAAYVYITNRKHILRLYVSEDSYEAVQHLVDGILEHIVAPEQPLE